MFGDVAHGDHWISGMAGLEDISSGTLVLGTSKGLGPGGHGVWGCWDRLWLRAPRVPVSPSGCFREYFVHKFRAMLGKNRVIFPGEKVPGQGGPAQGTRGWHQGR